MTALQKAIKYIAIAFAIFLSVAIIGGIISGLAGISLLFSGGDEINSRDMEEFAVENDISSLSIDLSGAELIIKTADKFAVESNHKYVKVSTKNGRLCIDETKKLFAFSPKGITVVLCIPKGFVFDDVEIETGAGVVKIEELSANTLDISLGAGEAILKNITANTKADIDGGAGELTIDGGCLNNLELDMGVGELTLKSRIEGKSSLDFGVGETNLVLLGSSEDYQIKIDKGLGEAKIDGKSIKGDSVYGNGINRIDIDGGVGEINIDFADYEDTDGLPII